MQGMRVQEETDISGEYRPPEDRRRQYISGEYRPPEDRRS
jgi:hypothetical protein